MTPTTTDIARAIDRERRDLAHNLSELKTRARAAVDWRTLVRRHPAPALGAAFASAFVLARWPRGAVSSAARRTREPAALADPARQGRRPPGLLGPLGAAVIGTATTVLAGALQDAVTGWIARRQRPR